MAKLNTLLQQRDLFRRGERVVDHLTEVIDDLRTDPHHAVSQVFEHGAIENAEVSDRRYRDGQERPLEGLPFTCKDNICTLEGTTDAGSDLLSGFKSPFEATVVRRLRDAGAILVGKTRLDEFGMGTTGEHTRGPTPTNPISASLDSGVDYVAGGSSCGAAILAATISGSFHLGSDTGGSVRLPASFCGVAGFKPSYGVCSPMF